MKKLFSVLLAVLMLAALCGIASAETGIGIEPGETMPDFTATLTDGTTVTLSELLKEKDLVVLNLAGVSLRTRHHRQRRSGSYTGRLTCFPELPQMSTARLSGS